ncbi:MAG: hypothetical protein JNL84_05430 [Candidatus Accumulibacter sp.]|nr:hypothetical protein [Accumulibacter sp.]
MDKTIRRYAAFFPRWCQAFGDHVPDPYGEAQAVEWLLGEDCVGVILLPEIRHLLMRNLLGPQLPELEFQPRAIRLNGHEYTEEAVLGHPGYLAMRGLLRGEAATHMFLTYHLIYPPGTRIITLSSKAPLPLLYKEMAPLRVTVVD